MDKKTKDFVFSVILILLGGYVTFEGWRMVKRAALPPFRIEHFSISPGMLPVVLGCALIAFSVLLLAGSLAGEGRAAGVLVRHVRTSSVRFGKAVGEVDMRSMTVCVVIMAVYTFVVLGRVPFWAGGAAFLVALMGYLRASKLWVILLCSGLSVACIVLLFVTLFKTTLP